MSNSQELRKLIEEELDGVSLSSLTRLVPEIQEKYQKRGNNKIIQSGSEALTYISYRMPSTLAAIEGAFEKIVSRNPKFSPESILDIGSGPGTVAWALANKFSAVKKFTLLERESEMIKLGKKLAAKSTALKNLPLFWTQADTLKSAPIEEHDLVVASYFFGEIPESKREELIKEFWAKTKSLLVLIEPAKSPQGFLALQKAREQLIKLGGHLLAPCVHNNTCPLSENHWCHFAARLERSSEHRQLKKGFRSYEDEKYSFIAVSREKIEQPEGIVLFPPLRRKGLLQFEMCTANGLEKKIYSKSKNEEFSELKKIEWGDVVSHSTNNA